MLEEKFYAAWPDFFEIIAEIEWCSPKPYDLLISGGVPEDAKAYLYSIVGYSDKEWWPYYIGKTFQKFVSTRIQQPDHKQRLRSLKENYPDLDFTVTLGTPTFHVSRATKNNIDAIEGLLIYGNWHEEMWNERKINDFAHAKQMHVRNVGWVEHLVAELSYGVFWQ
ncbi:hypothetical protein [Thiohalorhabdus denitrificans]|uniref:hypothetical protein n=1 Tax=Thiohalorhabdus denitrificans TaxID=381306 RepID=UPI000944AEB4|nr:hypothetical protein [Thiohalorhabdus denitrificans]